MASCDEEDMDVPDEGHKRRKVDEVRREDVYGAARNAPLALAPEKETDAHRIQQRLKQIEYGKNTLGYERYRREARKRGRDGPKTPDVHEKISKRAFDGKVKAWRRALHDWEQAHPAPSGGGSGTEERAEAAVATASARVTAAEPCDGDFDALFEDALVDAAPLTAFAPASAGSGTVDTGAKLGGAKPLPTAISKTLDSGARTQAQGSLRERLDSYKCSTPVGSYDDSAVFDDFTDDQQLVG